MEEHQSAAAQPKKVSPSWPRRLCKVVALFVGGLLLFVLLVLGGGLLWLRTDSARNLVLEQANTHLPTLLAAHGLSGKLTSLTGTLPCSFQAGMTLADAKGVFLDIPKANVDLDFGLFPPAITVSELRLVDTTLHRLPDLPQTPETPKPPTEPLKPKDIEALLKEIQTTIADLPHLPTIRITKTGIENFSLPKEIAGFATKVSVLLDCTLQQGEELPALRIGIPTITVLSDALSVTGSVLWESGKTKDTWLGGMSTVALNSTVEPAILPLLGDAGKDIAFDPITSRLRLDGSLFAPSILLHTEAKRLDAKSQKLRNGVFALEGKKLELLRAASNLTPLELNLALTGHLNEKPIRFAVKPFAKLASQEDFSTLSAGIKGLDMNALGLTAKGELVAMIAPQGLPQLSGHIDADIADWTQINAFVPGQTMAGRVTSKLVFAHPAQGQDVDVHLAIPHFSLKPSQGDSLALADLNANVAVKDCLGRGTIDARLLAKSIQAGPLGIALDSHVAGALTGPLSVTMATKGGVTSALRAKWQPGLLDIVQLDVSAHPGTFAKEFAKAKTPLGVRLVHPTTVHYGDTGFSVANLGINIVPAGKLSIKGGIRNAQCNLDMGLDGFDLGAWQALIPDLPKGLIRLKASVAGKAQSPSGQLRLGFERIQLPHTKLAPLDLAVNGKLQPGRGMQVDLDVPKKTLQTLGLERLDLKLLVPLLFAENGVPQVAEKGALSGNIALRGKIAPLWALANVADQKVTGVFGGDVRISGTIGSPAIAGTIQLDKTRFEDPINGVLLRDIFAKVAIDGKSGKKGLDGIVRINAGLSDGMGGTLTVTGQTPLDASNLALTTKIDHLRPLRRQDVRISLSGNVDVQGSAQEPQVTGTIVVDNGAIQLENIEAGPASVTTLPIADTKKAVEPVKVKTAKKAPAKGSGFLNLAIKSPGRFLVDGFGLSTEWKTDIAITGTPTNPIIAGEVAAVKGSMDFLNKIFTLEKGIITLNADNLANPLLDIVMANAGSDLTSYVRISGTVKKLKLSLTSDPAMPQDDVMAHILFGRNANELGRSEALQLAAAMGRLASGLGSGLNNPRKALGLDVMRVKSQGQGGSSSDEKWVDGMALESGKYINDYIYVGVEQGVKQNSTAGIIQLEITPKLKLEMRSQQSQTKGSLNWKHNY